MPVIGRYERGQKRVQARLGMTQYVRGMTAVTGFAIAVGPGKPREREVPSLLKPEFFRDRGMVAIDCVAMLRAEAGRDLYGRRPTDLVGELPTPQRHFGRRWSAHNVRLHVTGSKGLH